MTLDQGISIGIFLLSYSLIISNIVHRTIAAIIGGILTYILVLKPLDLLYYQNWQTLLFVFGMMIIIATMEGGGFFRWLGNHACRWVKLDPIRLFILFPFLAAFLSAFVDSITVMLFMTALSLEISSIIKMNPLPLILSEICAANIGGASTMVGDPPNIILGSYFNYSFMEFVRNTGPIALVALVINTVFFMIFYQRDILPVRKRVMAQKDEIALELKRMDPSEAILDKRLFFVGLFAFFYVVTLLTTHHLTGLSVATIAITGASLSLILGGPKKRMPEILEKIDWNTILFFAGLFLIVGGMEKTGVMEMVARYIGGNKGGRNFYAVIAIILWFSAFGSAIVDNVPFAAAMAPMLRHLSLSFGYSLPTLVWATALGTDIGGNGTPIGASANVVAIGTYERATGKTISWLYYCKSCFTAMIIVVAVAMVYLFLFYI